MTTMRIVRANGSDETKFVVATVAGLGIFGVTAYLLARSAKAKDKEVVPACNPKSSKSVCIDETCTQVVRGSEWKRGGLVFYVVENINTSDDQYDILGVPFPNIDVVNENTNRSLDKLVRDGLQLYTRKECWEGAPWFDLYLKDNPYPSAANSLNRNQYYDVLKAWAVKAKQWQAQQKKLAPALESLARDLMTFGTAAFMIRFGLKPGYVGRVADDAQSQAFAQSLPKAARERMTKLGYDLGVDLPGYGAGNTLDEFRANFDAVMDYISGDVMWSGKGFNVFRGENVPYDEEIDGKAMEFALHTSKESGVPWQATVASTGVLPIIQKAVFDDAVA